MPRSRVARLRASRTPADAELNVMPRAPVEPSPYLYATSTPGTSAFTHDKVMTTTVNVRACIIFMTRHGLISRTMLCRHCDDEMSMEAPCSFFAKLKLPLTKCFRLLLFWRSDLPVGVAQQWLDILDADTQHADCGPGAHRRNRRDKLEKKSKYGRGLQHPDNWLFGGVDRTTNLWFGIRTSADRKKKTLFPILRKHVKAKTTIISDAFASYVSVNGKHTLENNRFLRGMDYTHRWGAWEVRIKRHLKRMRGIRKELLTGYLDEFLWKTWFFVGKVPVSTYMEGLVMAIRKHYQL
ncbi:Hypothetical protein PHPALM_18568 [Phytophthora palmivora]|uniref:ISXO2-like transposase domain-containing protein n=1 Tax=Phytophthora palmivora TaxID=4796 RepID=A0A2P4XJE2_9STRA|nr:Hypothetical protein PHPALM_18568 [Phytophthora palmivora]